MFIAPLEVYDEASAIQFITWCVTHLGPGYHPDTLFSDYVDEQGIHCFSDADADLLDAATDTAFSFCDPYEVALSAAESQMLA